MFSKRRLSRRQLGFSFEGLENRCLFSMAHAFGPPAMGGNAMGGNAIGGNTIEFDQAPTAVQTGLDNLATADNATAPTSTQTVFLANQNGVEIYSVDIASTGKNTILTVDVSGDPVTAPTRSSTTFGAITNTAVTSEISAIATALGLTAPDSTATVQVLTPSSGSATYTITLDSSSGHHRTTISVDANGNPVGNESIPFSTLPTTIQNGLLANEPTGTTLSATSTQNVQVQTIDGVTLYTMSFNGDGTFSSVTVNESGTLTSLPSQSTVQFGTVPSAAATELQTLATADGVTTTIASTQNVREYSEPNGTTVYSLVLMNSSDQPVAISVDEDGNPTAPPSDGGFGGGFGGFLTGPIFGGFGFGSDSSSANGGC